eukprot:Skav203199  [mRNA]  locus=scaffold2115:216931:232192:+ [translate_table: standard]
MWGQLLFAALGRLFGGAAFAATITEEPIAFDEQGRPIIIRSVDESGQTRHLVCNEDGKVHTFGERTVDSLLGSEEDLARKWVEGLSHRDMRGLVHELGQRLLRSSQLYQQQQAGPWRKRW